MPIIPKFVGCHPDNFRVGRHAQKPFIICIHITDGGMPDGWFLMGNAQRQAAFDATAADATRKTGVQHTPQKAEPTSAHYGVSKAGEIHQYVREPDSAFANGISVDQAKKFPPTWKLYQLGMNVNDVSISIEHQGVVADIWPAAQIEASAQLIAAIALEYSIPLDHDHVVGHHEIWKGHACPGTNCPMDALIARAAQIINPTT